jgi:hypothetical protein
MTQTVKRRLFVLVAAALVAAIATSTALAAPGHGRSGSRMGARAGFVRFAGVGMAGGPGFRVFFGGGPGGHRLGIGIGIGPAAAAGTVLSADVLTPAASFLGFSSVSALASDLNGGKTLAREATAKGKTADALIDAIVAAQQKVYDAENAAGWITDAQQTAILADLTSEITKLVNVGPPVPPAKRPGPLDAAATYLGMTVADLHADLKAGKTLADEATANGKTVDGLVTALTAQAKTNLDKAVADGRITAAQEQTLLADLTKHVTDVVNNTKPASPSTKMKRLMSLFKR